MSTLEALRGSEGKKHQPDSSDTWPEDLPHDAAALGKELEQMQPVFESGGERPVPEDIKEIAEEVCKLLFATGPFPQAMAPDLAADMERLRAFYEEQGADGSQREPETAQG
ncbi:MAG: hypothetical protein V1876_03145 [Candidatus Peregrinibacteria bacterium]